MLINLFTHTHTTESILDSSFKCSVFLLGTPIFLFHKKLKWNCLRERRLKEWKVPFAGPIESSVQRQENTDRKKMGKMKVQR